MHLLQPQAGLDDRARAQGVAVLQGLPQEGHARGGAQDLPQRHQHPAQGREGMPEVKKDLTVLWLNRS